LNWACIYDNAASVQAAVAAGHQVGSHTWDHTDLTTLTADGIATEMNKLKTAFTKILGYSPLYVRPPYGSHNDLVDATLSSLGYKVSTLWDIDSGDAAGATMATQQANYNNADSTLHIGLEHDTKQTTADTLAPFIIQWAKSVS
jgi:peptidoglycan/xylan/chitin deacetylase (PgdA/CDA1 family)